MMRVDVLAANFEILNICGQSTVLASLQAAQGAEHLTQNLTCNEIHTVAHCVIEHSQQGQLHEGCQGSTLWIIQYNQAYSCGMHAHVRTVRSNAAVHNKQTGRELLARTFRQA